MAVAKAPPDNVKGGRTPAKLSEAEIGHLEATCHWANAHGQPGEQVRRKSRSTNSSMRLGSGSSVSCGLNSDRADLTNWSTDFRLTCSPG